MLCLCAPARCAPQGDEMEREARKYAEQQAEIFREKAADLDQRLHKQMAKVGCSASSAIVLATATQAVQVACAAASLHAPSMLPPRLGVCLGT
jgi:hypothetical protein